MGEPAYHAGDASSRCVHLRVSEPSYAIQPSAGDGETMLHIVELMWLTGRLARDFDDHRRLSRRDLIGRRGSRKSSREFIELSRQIGLFGDAAVAIDGSKFEAVSDRDNELHAAQVEGVGCIAARGQQLRELSAERPRAPCRIEPRPQCRLSGRRI